MYIFCYGYKPQYYSITYVRSSLNWLFRIISVLDQFSSSTIQNYGINKTVCLRTKRVPVVVHYRLRKLPLHLPKICQPSSQFTMEDWDKANVTLDVTESPTRRNRNRTRPDGDGKEPQMDGKSKEIKTGPVTSTVHGEDSAVLKQRQTNSRAC